MKIWIYTEQGQQGPFTPEQLSAMGIAPDTPVWYDGLPRWMAAKDALSDMPGFTPFEAAAPAEAVVEVAETATDEEQAAPAAESPAESAPKAAEPAAAHADFRESIYRQQRAAWQGRQDKPLEEMPPTHIGWSIFLMVCCCGSPFALAAIIGSIVTSARNGQGDYAGARKASTVTEWLIMLAFSLGVIMMPLYMMLF